MGFDTIRRFKALCHLIRTRALGIIAHLQGNNQCWIECGRDAAKNIVVCSFELDGVKLANPKLKDSLMIARHRLQRLIKWLQQYIDAKDFNIHDPGHIETFVKVITSETRRIKWHEDSEGAIGYDFSSMKPTKSDETGYIRVEKLAELVKTYSGKGPSPQLMALLSGLDREKDGWVLFEEFEAGLIPELLVCAEEPEGNDDWRRKPSDHRRGRSRGSRRSRGALSDASEEVAVGKGSEDPRPENGVDENGNIRSKRCERAVGKGSVKKKPISERLCAKCAKELWNVCFYCKEEGHWSGSCPSRACYNCARLGHIARACPEPMKTRERRDGRENRSKRTSRFGAGGASVSHQPRYEVPLRAESRIIGNARPSVSPNTPDDSHGSQTMAEPKVDDRGVGGTDEILPIKE